MNILINPTKLLYGDNKNCRLNLGNFIETGKYIELDNYNTITFFSYLTTPVDYNLAVKKLMKISKNSKDECEEAINYLLHEKILIKEEEFKSIIADDRNSRILLYFFMISGKNLLDNYKQVISKKILILGLGGIGSITAELLVRSGFNNFVLLDCDFVEESNLNRQLAYTQCDVGLKKTECLKKRLLSINKDVQIEIIDAFVKSHNDLQINIDKTIDFVICTLDKPLRVVRREVNKYCVEHNIPVFFAGFTEHMGMVGPFIIPNKTACLNCIDKEVKNLPINEIPIVPSYAPLCNIVASYLTDETINFFLKIKKQNLQGKTLMVNLYDNKNKLVKWTKNNKCNICGRET